MFNHERDITANTNVMQWGVPITGVNTIAERLLFARTRLKLSQQDVAERAGVSQGTIGNIEASARKNPRDLLAIAAAVDATPDWLLNGRGLGPGAALSPHSSEGVAIPTVAHPLTQSTSMMTPTPIAWESVVNPLPQLFRVTLPDDAMSPDYPKGSEVIFSTTEGQPRANDCVLLLDADKHPFFRRYVERRPGHWQAEATSAGFEPLDSRADGLSVLAIKVGMWGRSG